MYGPSFESGLSLKLFKIFILSDILADYYTALVTSFKFVVIQENLGFFFYVRSAVWKNSLSLKSRCARDSD